MKSVQKIKVVYPLLFLYVLMVFLLTLTSINVTNYFAPKKVLGIETQTKSPQDFWEGFTKTNPNYIPGYIELGQTEKVREIDPNYIIP